MLLTRKQRKEFEQATRPLMKWIGENCYPHVKVIVDYSRAELNEGVVTFETEDYRKD